MISSSLRTGNPLPQVTPCPLMDRFMMKYHGLNVIHQDSEEDYGLPRLLTLDTMKDEQYMCVFCHYTFPGSRMPNIRQIHPSFRMFCVGISTAYSVMNRLDRLMLATKEIVGEQYHIHGVGVAPWSMDSNQAQTPVSGGAGFSLSPSLTSQRGATTSAGVSFGVGVVGSQKAVKEV